jgi:hypothetical protein
MDHLPNLLDPDVLARALEIAQRLPSWLKPSGTATAQSGDVERARFVRCTVVLAVAQKEFETAIYSFHPRSDRPSPPRCAY